MGEFLPWFAFFNADLFGTKWLRKKYFSENYIVFHSFCLFGVYWNQNSEEDIYLIYKQQKHTLNRQGNSSLYYTSPD